ncbi:hypothetical protein HY030_00315 [Candidatus Gottesmanbacteria bacterium]|nr:hypothetical protein [Candidatus Gottesmanbacteria bacterium]
MFSYTFVLGKATDLCRKELEIVLRSKNIFFKTVYFSGEIYHLETEKELDTFLIKELGGTIKIAKVFSPPLGSGQIAALIANFLKTTPLKKITFGLSLYGQNKPLSLNFLAMAKEIKQELIKDSYSCRFVLAKEGNVLTSVQITKQKVQEIIISSQKEKVWLAATEFVQDFEDWNKRDYSRPEADPKSGMLPPKVARMMVNIGNLNGKTLLDPFCGMGTILQEGLSLGFKVIGSDYDKKAVLKAETNLEWFCKEYKVASGKYQILNGRAEKISEKIEPKVVDVIVTEPYLGPDILPKTGLENIIDGLSRLYLGCFSDWKKILKAKDGLIVIALPSFFMNGREYLVSYAIDKIINLGYSIETGPLPYYRPQAVVRRNIYVFKIRN